MTATSSCCEFTKMSQVQFKGAVNGISDRQLDFVRKVLEKRGYTNENVFVQIVGKDGDNYATCVKRFIVEKNGKKFQMVAKIAPTMKVPRIIMKTVLTFKNEHVMYTEVLPKFAKLQQKYNVTEKDRLQFVTCYGSLNEAPHEIILLEDLETTSYVILDKLVSLKDNAVKLVLKQFAILHSLSYVLRKLEPETFEEYTNKLRDFWFVIGDVENSKASLQNLETEMLAILDNSTYETFFKGTLSRVSALAEENWKIDKQSKYSVIQHGDPWTNNIMFRLEGEKVIKCCMIDYQLSKLSSPVADLLYMIFNCTDNKTRAKHYYEWIDYYHSELDNALSYFGLKADVMYPRNVLDADLKRHGKFSFVQLLFGACILVRESSEGAKLKDTFENATSVEEATTAIALSSLDGKTILKFKKRVYELVESLLAYGYLKSERTD